MEEIPVTQARAELADLVNRVAYSGDRIVLTRHGRPLAVLLSPAELERLQAEDLETGHPEAGPVTEERPVRRFGLSSPPPIEAPPATEPTRSGYEIAARHHDPATPQPRNWPH